MHNKKKKLVCCLSSKWVGFRSDFSYFCGSIPDLFSGRFLDLKPSEISLSFLSVLIGWIFSLISLVFVVPLQI